MSRLIAIVALFFLTLISFFAPLAAIHPGTILIGGEYTVQPGEIRHGDLLAVLRRSKLPMAEKSPARSTFTAANLK